LRWQRARAADDDRLPSLAARAHRRRWVAGLETLLAPAGDRVDVTIVSPELKFTNRSMRERPVDRLASVKPAGPTWPMPLYDLALMTAADCAAHDREDIELSLVTPDRRGRRRHTSGRAHDPCRDRRRSDDAGREARAMARLPDRSVAAHPTQGANHEQR
jgi:hypothetical protein